MSEIKEKLHLFREISTGNTVEFNRTPFAVFIRKIDNKRFASHQMKDYEPITVQRHSERVYELKGAKQCDSCHRILGESKFYTPKDKTENICRGCRTEAASRRRRIKERNGRF